jgi:dUTP pyrophosphatase
METMMNTSPQCAMIRVKFKFLHPVWEEQKLAYSTPFSAGLDLRACFDSESLSIGPGERAPIGTGLAIEILEPGIAGFVYSRSGLGTKDGLVVSQGVGVIDPDYRGEIIVSLLNTSKEERTIQRCQRIAQLLFQPFFQSVILPVAELSPTTRGSGGFGHTGTL